MLAKRRYFVERSIGSLLDLEKAMAVRFNTIEYPVSHYNLPKLRIQDYIKKSMDKKTVFSTVDLKMMIGNCCTFLNLLACQPLFMVSSLRTFLGIHNLNFREVDLFIERMTQDEKEHHDTMRSSLMQDENKDLLKSLDPVKSPLQLRGSFWFKGIDRHRVAGKMKYTLFCRVGQTKWYVEKTTEDLEAFVKSLMMADRSRREDWLR